MQRKDKDQQRSLRLPISSAELLFPLPVIQTQKEKKKCCKKYKEGKQCKKCPLVG